MTKGGAERPRLTISLSDETIIVHYPDGQEIAIPARESQRLITMLRYIQPREAPGRWLAQRKFVAAFQEDDVKEAGRKRRLEEAAKAQAKQEKEKQQRMKRIAKRDRLKAATELLNLLEL